jgi:maleylpyruvate isomerase
VNEFALFSYFRSSASFRARIALNLKGITYDYKAVHLLKEGGEQFNPEYAKLNPSRQVPTLIHKGVAIGQTMAIIDYLDSVQPTPRLFPTAPGQRAFVTQACEIVNSGIQPFGNTATMNYLKDVLKLDEDARKKWLSHWLSNGSRTLEAFLAPRAKDFAMGNEVSAADCFVFPHLISSERFGARYEDGCPTLIRLRKTYMQTEPFRMAMPDQQPDFEN